jgi:hypothetical protein
MKALRRFPPSKRPWRQFIRSPVIAEEPDDNESKPEGKLREHLGQFPGINDLELISNVHHVASRGFEILGVVWPRNGWRARSGESEHHIPMSERDNSTVPLRIRVLSPCPSSGYECVMSVPTTR